MKRLHSVIPAHTGIQSFQVVRIILDSRLNACALKRSGAQAREWQFLRIHQF